MNILTAPPLIQRRLLQAQNRYNGLRLLQHAGTFLAAASVAAFALLFAVERSWLTSRKAFDLIVALGGFGLALAGFILLCVMASRQRQAAFLAAAIEGARPDLQDRLNTLVHLADPANAAARRHFGPVITHQASAALGGETRAPLYPRTRAWVHLAVGLGCLLGTVAFARHYQPLRNLVSASALAPTEIKQPPPEAPFELETKNAAETTSQPAWGEVRIIEPGHDQKMTKLDVVPLRIEMAARDPLSTHEWVTSVNGQPEVAHPLDTAPEPCFAAYSVLLYLDELKVSDWDVVSYYARAQTTKGGAYASQIYFIEIRPFRDDLIKAMPGGAGGKAFKMLGELTDLVAEQGKILRETHQHERMTYARVELQTEDRRKLAGAEGDLALATSHTYSKMASEMENADIGNVLSHLSTAEGHMNRGADALRSDVVAEGKTQQEQALTELVATRKALQKAVSEHPDKFGEAGDSEPTPTADSAKSELAALQQVSEFRDQEKAAQAEVAKMAAEERRLSARASSDYRTKGKELAAQQDEMIERMDELAKENPELFAAAKDAREAASADMKSARDHLTAGGNAQYQVHRDLVHAGDHLADLNAALKVNQGQRDLERAYAMKKAVDRSARALQQAEAKPNAMTPGEADALAEEARQSARGLQSVSGQGFGPELADALSEQKQAELDAELKRMQAGKGAARAQAAGEARKNLENVSKAFDASRPSLVRNSEKHDPLGGRGGTGQGQQPGEGQGNGALDALIDKLRSLGLQDRAGHPLSKEARAKERSELMGELEAVVPKTLGKSDAAIALLAEARQELSKDANLPVDPEVIKHLQEKLESMQASAAEKAAAGPAAEGTSVVDASHAPASYRQRLERYYETLSKLKP